MRSRDAIFYVIMKYLYCQHDFVHMKHYIKGGFFCTCILFIILFKTLLHLYANYYIIISQTDAQNDLLEKY